VGLSQPDQMKFALLAIANEEGQAAKPSQNSWGGDESKLANGGF